MSYLRTTSTNALKLRKAAEKKVRFLIEENGSQLDLDAVRLYHELQVHQIELEMQHAELLQSRQALDLLLDQYQTLYDFAPVSYLTLDRAGTVLKCNHAAALLVGTVRPKINSQPFARYVAAADRHLFAEFLEQVFREQPLETTCRLRLLKMGQAVISVQMKAQADPSDQRCLLAIVDVREGSYCLSPAPVPLSSLSRRERETLKYVAEGKTNSAIAELMKVSPKSVETYRSRMMQKLGISNVPDLVKFALLCGVTSL